MDDLPPIGKKKGKERILKEKREVGVVQQDESTVTEKRMGACAVTFPGTLS